MSELENIGVNNAEADSVSAAYDMYKNGASIGEVNAKYFNGSADANTSAPVVDSSDNTDLATHKVETHAGTNDLGSGLPSSDDSTASGVSDDDNVGSSSAVRQSVEDDNKNNDATVGEQKIFSQKELDSLIGRRIHEERRLRDAAVADKDTALDEIAKLLGVSRDEALSAIKKANYRKEAEESDVADVDLFERLKIAEEKNADYEREMKNRADAKRIEDYKNEITMQVNKLAGVIPGDTLSACSTEKEFTDLVNYFYDNELTRNDCVSLAYNIYAKRKGLDTSTAPRTQEPDEGAKDGVVDVPANGQPQGRVAMDGNLSSATNAGTMRTPDSKTQRRMVEGAFSGGTAAPDTHLDPDNMTAEELEKLFERVRRGERIVP